MWRHQGLNFDAPFPLGVLAPAGQPVDVRVSIGPKAPLGPEPSGLVLAELRTAERTMSTVYALDDGYLVRFRGRCDFFVGTLGADVRCTPRPEFDLRLLPVFMLGTISALLLTVRGFAVLHGSAVCWGNSTVLFTGHPGTGKTTVAALCCAAGARFVTDDLVPLVKTDAGMACVGLSNELRLREGAAGVADLFAPPGVPRRTTADDRLAIQPPPAGNERNLVGAVVLPRPSRGDERVSITVLSPSAGMAALLANSRIPGLVDQSLKRPYFEAAAELATTVPVIEARLPWALPYTTTFVPDLFAQLSSVAPF